MCTKRTYVPGPRADAILEAIGRYHFLSAQQVIHLLLRPSIRSNGYLHLQKLTDNGYLSLRDWLPPPPGASGKAQTGVWSIGPKGRLWLKAREVPLPPPRKASHGSLETSTLRHLLAINDCLIELEKWCSTSRWQLQEVQHDVILKRLGLKAIPDAMAFLSDGSLHPALWWEIDYSGKEEEKRWKAKIAAIVECYLSGQYQQAFGTPNLTLLVVVYRGDARMRALVRWTEETLTSLSSEQWGRNFRFTSVTPQTVVRGEFISGEHWITPYTYERNSLLPGS